jgi:hypothetical protein
MSGVLSALRYPSRLDLKLLDTVRFDHSPHRHA